MRPVIELVGQAIEALAVAIIEIAIVHGTVRYLFHLNQKVADAYTLYYKVQLGRALLLGLEFLVAADIIAQIPARRSRYLAPPRTRTGFLERWLR